MNKTILYLVLTGVFFALNSCSNAVEPLRIMSYNIRLDVESDGVNQWSHRRDGVVALLEEENPDIFGIQEGLPHQVSFLSQQLVGYSMIGKGRDGGDNGEYSAIYYKKNKLKLLKSETLWLSETQKKPTVGWDAALNRIVTYGVFSTVNSNKKIVVYNTHFDHIGKQARENSAKLILHHINANNFSKEQLVVLGDLNAAPEEAPIKLLSNHLEDAFTSTPVKKPIGTFNAFNIHSKLVRRIDYVFTKNLDVIEYRHIQKKLPNGLWPSDHLPVIISIKN
jgi:endonuclease/exonuclease/phosphatase family metal-dependent hydrolase